MIKLWNWDDNWHLKQTFTGHTNYVMQVAINPKDTNSFATASLDKTVKVWHFGSGQADFTFTGHNEGVNCVDYFHVEDNLYLISGADDHLVRIWDYQVDQNLRAYLEWPCTRCVIRLFSSTTVSHHYGEDCTLRLYQVGTFRFLTTFAYNLGRVWSAKCFQAHEVLVIGYDEGILVLEELEKAIPYEKDKKRASSARLKKRKIVKGKLRYESILHTMFQVFVWICTVLMVLLLLFPPAQSQYINADQTNNSEIQYKIRKDHSSILKLLEKMEKKLKMEEPNNDILARITSLLVKVVNKEDKTYTILEFLIAIAEYGFLQLGTKIAFCDGLMKMFGRERRRGDDDVESDRRSPRRRRRRRRMRRFH